MRTRMMHGRWISGGVRPRSRLDSRTQFRTSLAAASVKPARPTLCSTARRGIDASGSVELAMRAAANIRGSDECTGVAE